MQVWTAVIGVAALVVAGAFFWMGQHSGDLLTDEVEESQLAMADGTPYSVWSGGPKNSNKAVLIVHDWFGISEMTKATVARLAAQGYRAVAVDLYGGEAATTHAEAGALMGALAPEAVSEKLQVALDSLKSPKRSIAIIGFSMGAPLALRATMADPVSVAATVLFYGVVDTDPAVLESIQSPVLYMTGSKDNAQNGFSFAGAMEQLNRKAELFIYPGARHAYAQPLFNNGQNYDAVATRVSWMLADDFLNRQFGE